jgi:hypothetical protein
MCKLARQPSQARRPGTFKGEAISKLLRAFNNAADESLRLALWVKIDEKKRSSSNTIWVKCIVWLYDVLLIGFIYLI